MVFYQNLLPRLIFIHTPNYFQIPNTSTYLHLRNQFLFYGADYSPIHGDNAIEVKGEAP
jgi:hypothetical protein